MHIFYILDLTCNYVTIKFKAFFNSYLCDHLNRINMQNHTLLVVRWRWQLDPLIDTHLHWMKWYGKRAMYAM